MAGQQPNLHQTGPDQVTVHASAVAAGGRAALIRGPSGAGKSHLALRCISMASTPFLPHQASLVSDDQTIIERSAGQLFASAPARLAGLLEVRGIGIVRVNEAITPARTPLVLVVDLEGSDDTAERLPDPWPTVALLGVELPVLRLKSREVSAPERLLVALSCHSLPATG